MANTGMDVKLEVAVATEVADAVRGSFVSRNTCGDGACVIHAVFGTLSYSGQYFCNNAREFFCNSIGHTYDAFRSKLDPSLLMQWERNVWLDMVQPCVHVGFDVSSLPSTTDN